MAFRDFIRQRQEQAPGETAPQQTPQTARELYVQRDAQEKASAKSISPDIDPPFSMRVLVPGHYRNRSVSATVFAGGGRATGGCPNATRDVQVGNVPALVRVAPRESGIDVELAEGPKIPGSEFRKREDDRSGVDAVPTFHMVRLSAMKNSARKERSGCGVIATSGRIYLAGAALHARTLKHCLGDMSITFWIWIFSLLLVQVLVALHSSSHYVAPFKRREPGRLP